jgi:hypothetical protein
MEGETSDAHFSVNNVKIVKTEASTMDRQNASKHFVRILRTAIDTGQKRQGEDMRSPCNFTNRVCVEHHLTPLKATQQFVVQSFKL